MLVDPKMKTLLVMAFVLSGCSTSYTPPLSSGLHPIAAFPGPGDVCQTVAANDATLDLTTQRNGLIACPTHERGAISDRTRDGFNVVGPIGDWTLLHAGPTATGSSTPLSPPFSATGAKHLIEKTVVFFDDFHGTQVAYFTADGREYLWYPGNQRSLPGFWRTTADKKICFSYPTSSIKPATGVAGADWECGSLSGHSARIVQVSEGDVFNLTSGKIPFVMERRRKYRLDDLRSQ